MLLVLVSGMRGAGKSLFAEVGEGLRIPCFEMSQPLVELMLKTDIIITNFSLREFSDALRREKGSDILARMTAARVREEAGDARLAVVLGVRSQEEIDYFIAHGFEVKTAAVLADEKTRFVRVQKRRRPEDTKSLDDFRWADKLELGWGLGALLGRADFRLENKGRKEDAKEKIRGFLSALPNP